MKYLLSILTVSILGLTSLSSIALAQENISEPTQPQTSACIANDSHLVGVNDEVSSVALSGLEACVNDAKKNPHTVVAICNLDDANFSQCLSSNAYDLVRHAKDKPRAYNGFKLVIVKQGVVNQEYLLTPKEGTLETQFSGISVTVNTKAESPTRTDVKYTLNGVNGEHVFVSGDQITENANGINVSLTRI
jgi:hypothetical protein